MLDELCSEEAVTRLLHDQFGNYVIQRALTVANVDMGARLVDAIRPHLPALANSSGGRRITAVSTLVWRTICFSSSIDMCIYDAVPQRILKRFPDMLMSAGPSYMTSIGMNPDGTMDNALQYQ